MSAVARRSILLWKFKKPWCAAVPYSLLQMEPQLAHNVCNYSVLSYSIPKKCVVGIKCHVSGHTYTLTNQYYCTRSTVFSLFLVIELGAPDRSNLPHISHRKPMYANHSPPSSTKTSSSSTVQNILRGIHDIYIYICPHFMPFKILISRKIYSRRQVKENKLSRRARKRFGENLCQYLLRYSNQYTIKITPTDEQPRLLLLGRSFQYV